MGSVGDIAVRQRALNDIARDFSSGLFRLWGDMGVALRGLWLGVTKQMLNDIKRDATVDEKACEGMAEVMKADVGEPGPVSDTNPGVVDAWGWFTRLGVGEDVGTALNTGDALEEGNAAWGKGDLAGLPGFREGDQECFVLPVDVVPFGLGDFVASGSSQ